MLSSSTTNMVHQTTSDSCIFITPPPLSKWKNICMENAHVILSKIGPYKLFYWDIARTAPNQELESEVIKAYLTVVVREYNKNNPEWAALIDTSAIWMGKLSRLKIDPKESCIQKTKSGPDGRISGKIEEVLGNNKVFTWKKGCNVSRWTCSTLPHTRQQDSTSCGVLAVKVCCDICQRWFHHDCVQKPPLDIEYLCPACGGVTPL
ncbi:hypothetical protein MHYP_G00204600 [Metynnis hypsauchen]